MSTRGLSREVFTDLAGLILERGHRLRFQAGGKSMLPFIEDGDILEVAPAEAERLRCGDIILAQTGNRRLLAHRIIKVKSSSGKASFLIKGDACSHPDGWFTIENILGKVISIDRDNQRISLTTKSRRWKAGMWVRVAPFSPILPWLPKRFRRYLRKVITGMMD